ncbi:MAG TPA: hypothetical protein VK611_27400 [Acidimicrobiales bacterium]|nr:hypothetical protein [Acidimicrobiales bacterium]
MGAVLADDELRDDDGAPETGTTERAAAAEGPTVHRWSDLDRRGRWIAAAFTAALLLAPTLAFARYLPDWVPAGDPAFMGLRALDVGTGRTPLVGQPSTSADYVDGHLVHHLGPSHFYLLAPFMRLLGPATGMLLVSTLITGGSVLVAAWAMFRQLGPAAGAIAAVVLGTTTFTTGASSLANPVSSSISGYPLLCSAVLLWCLLCGDLRLLPLTALFVSFTAQQHLAVLPALALMTGAGVAGFLVLELPRWRRLVRPALVAAGVALLVWSPVIVQELFGTDGNLSGLRRFAASSSRPKLGLDDASRHVLHTLGLPPLLGRTQLDGTWFFGSPSLLTWLSAGAVVAALLAAAVRWRRAGDRRRAMLVAMAVAAALGGLVNGSSVPVGIEQYRLPFYHWAFVLAFFVTTALVLLVGDVATASWLPRRPRLGDLRAAVLPGLGLLAVALPAVVNPSLERRSNTLLAAYSPVTRSVLDDLDDGVMESQDRLDGPVAVLSRGEGTYVGLREALALDLYDRGLDVRHPWASVSFVDWPHLAHASDVQAGLVLVVDKAFKVDQAVVDGVPGELLVDIDGRTPVDEEAWEGLLAEAEATDEVVLGPAAEQLIEGQASEAGRIMVREHLTGFTGDGAEVALGDRRNLELLLETPLEQPDFDPDLIRRMLRSLPEPSDNAVDWRLRIFLLDREELLAWAPDELLP